MKGRAMLAMVASSTTISWATEMSTRAHPRWRWPWPRGRLLGLAGWLRWSWRFLLSVGCWGVGGRSGRVAAGRMISSTTWATVFSSAGSPSTKLRCRMIPARAGASRSRSRSAVISPRSRARSNMARVVSILGPRTRVRNSSAKSGSWCSAVMTPAITSAERWSVRPPWPQDICTRSSRRLPVSGVGGLERLLGLQDRVDDQRGLGGPAPVEGGLAGLRLGGDGVHGHPVVADLGEQVERGVEDLRLALALDAGAGAGGLPGLRHGGPRRLVHMDETKRFRFIRER